MKRLSRQSQSVQHRRAGRFFFLVASALAVAGCQQAQRHVLYGVAQGTYYNIQYYDRLNRDLQPSIDSLLEAFDQSASLWVDSSLLRQINAGLTDSLDDILLALTHHSIDIMDYTNGAFDPRVGKLVQAWGFSFEERTEPDSARLATLLDEAHSPIAVVGNRLVRDNAATELDFNAIAQGYSSDLVAKMLESRGISDYLVDIGGEVVAHGRKNGKGLWRVGIEKPAASAESAPTVQLAIGLDNASVVTSGSYRKFYERDGVRYSHTIDPSTGRPVQHTLLSASVVEESSWLADAMATAYMVMGLDSALSFISHHPGERGTDAVFFIYDDNGQMATHATPGFNKLILQQ